MVIEAAIGPLERSSFAAVSAICLLGACNRRCYLEAQCFIQQQASIAEERQVHLEIDADIGNALLNILEEEQRDRE